MNRVGRDAARPDPADGGPGERDGARFGMGRAPRAVVDLPSGGDTADRRYGDDDDPDHRAPRGSIDQIGGGPQRGGNAQHHDHEHRMGNHELVHDQCPDRARRECGDHATDPLPRHRHQRTDHQHREEDWPHVCEEGRAARSVVEPAVSLIEPHRGHGHGGSRERNPARHERGAGPLDNGSAARFGVVGIRRHGPHAYPSRTRFDSPVGWRRGARCPAGGTTSSWIGTSAPVMDRWSERTVNSVDRGSPTTIDRSAEVLTR